MANNKVLVLDTYYQDFIDSVKHEHEGRDYLEQLGRIIELSFGTSDFYSRNLASYGFQTEDIIANHYSLQAKWCLENGQRDIHPYDIVRRQIEKFKPAILFCQDLSFLPPTILREIKMSGIKLFGQCSCPMPPKENVELFDVLFTSFPHYVDEFRSLGVRAIYNRLAFDPIVLKRINAPAYVEPVYDVTFVGGVGTPSHWSYGMEVLEAIAREIPTAKFWGYGYDRLPSSSEVKNKYQGQAWGNHMYEILVKSKIVVNRHGEVAKHFANNMKMFETTGCSALLLTDQKSNLHDIFRVDSECVAYTSAQDAVEKIKDLLADEQRRDKIARAGCARTLGEYTYYQTMGLVAEVMKEELG